MAMPGWLDEVRRAGRDPDVVWADRARVAAGTPPLMVERPCVVHDGVQVLHAPDQDEARGRQAASGAVAFVPASGAATRLFAAWRRASDAGHLDAPGLDAVAHLPLWEGDDDPDRRQVGLHATLAKWAGAPKGLVPIHPPRRCAVDEHLAEAAWLGLAGVHFTVAGAHRAAFAEASAAATMPVSLSEQSPRTDTIGFTDELEPMRVDGALVFRPSGHGALLGNLAAAAATAPAGLVVVKNIDNVVADVHRGAVLPWRRRLLGRCDHLRAAQHDALRRADRGAAQAVLAEAFGLDIGRDDALHELDRPFRVAGVVRDDGEPGGGPYWVRGGDGRVRAQIVEGAQLSADDPVHERARAAATHFNPVDMVLSVQGVAGPYDLTSFVDRQGHMIVRKSVAGQPLLAVERPGLWNGSMAGWNTLFVELPAYVFQPVKTVADLLRPAHRGLPLE